MHAVQLLSEQLDAAYRMIRERIEGLTEEEFWWEPVADAWTVRQSPDGRWAADYEVPDPVPSPFTTIGWRLVHVGECKIMYHEYAFGPGTLTWPDIDSAHTAAAAIAQLDAGQQLLANALAGLDDAELDAPRATNWGEQWPTWKVFWTMIHHDIQHGAEIGALREVYRLARGGIGLQPLTP